MRLTTREGPYTATLATFMRKGRAVAPIVREFAVHLYRAANRLTGAARHMAPAGGGGAAARSPHASRASHASGPAGPRPRASKHLPGT